MLFLAEAERLDDDEGIILTFRDENGLRAADIIVRSPDPDDIIYVRAERVENDPTVRFEVA